MTELHESFGTVSTGELCQVESVGTIKKNNNTKKTCTGTVTN